VCRAATIKSPSWHPPRTWRGVAGQDLRRRGASPATSVQLRGHREFLLDSVGNPRLSEMNPPSKLSTPSPRRITDVDLVRQPVRQSPPARPSRFGLRQRSPAHGAALQCGSPPKTRPTGFQARHRRIASSRSPCGRAFCWMWQESWAQDQRPLRFHAVQYLQGA